MCKRCAIESNFFFFSWFRGDKLKDTVGQNLKDSGPTLIQPGYGTSKAKYNAIHYLIFHTSKIEFQMKKLIKINTM